MLKEVVRFSFSPSAFQASLQTSTVQAGNRTTGAAMSLIKKIDVEEHFAARRRMRLAAIGFTRKPASKGNSVPAPTTAKAKGPGFREDFSAEHSSPGLSVTPSK
jgi:hypothetical protein